MTLSLSTIPQLLARKCRIALATWKLHMATRTVRECESNIDYAKHEVTKAEAAYAISMAEAADAKAALEKLLEGV